MTRESGGGPAPEDMLHDFPEPLGGEVRTLVERLGSGGAAIFPVLEAVQRERGDLSDTSFQVAARALAVRPADLKEAALRSGRFSVERRPAHALVVCVHKHCRGRGALGLLETIRRVTGLLPGQSSAGGELSVETVRCVGWCKIGPNLLVDGSCYNAVEPDGLRRILRALVPAGAPSIPGGLRSDAR